MAALWAVFVTVLAFFQMWTLVAGVSVVAVLSVSVFWRIAMRALDGKKPPTIEVLRAQNERFRKWTIRTELAGGGLCALGSSLVYLRVIPVDAQNFLGYTLGGAVIAVFFVGCALYVHYHHKQTGGHIATSDKGTVHKVTVK